MLRKCTCNRKWLIQKDKTRLRARDRDKSFRSEIVLTDVHTLYFHIYFWPVLLYDIVVSLFQDGLENQIFPLIEKSLKKKARISV